MSVNKTSSLDNFFTFRESEKSLKKTPLGFFYAMNMFYEPEKNRKKTRNFDTRFREHDQSVEMNAQGPFPFCKSMKNPKTNLFIDDTILLLSL